MKEHCVSQTQLQGFAVQLAEEERSRATIEKYLRDVRQFAAWLEGRPVTKAAVALWKEVLCRTHASATVNAKLSALDRFLLYLGLGHCRVKHLKLQRKLFQAPERELSRAEYERLVDAAERMGRPRTGLILETLCASGIRVSELQFITVEAARLGKAEISLKGKVRTILLPTKLCRKLLKYAQKHKIASGEIFLTRSGRRISRKQIWAEMKSVCKAADVAPSKVFPHNLRHLFARVFYRACRDVARLADVLGHSSIETTRIYLISTGSEHVRTLEQLRLVN